jgi:hypothetical protein
MRAKVVSVALVACGVIGATAVAAPFPASQLANRGRGGGERGHDNGQHDNTYNHACTSNDHALIGNVCVIVDDLPILGNLLTA